MPATIIRSSFFGALPQPKPVRLLGVSLSSLQSDIEETLQLDLPI
jgi:hypothetical protein